jgi:hypothetical protein
LGCYGELSQWISVQSATAITTIASGTYSLCGRIDYDRDYPAATADSLGEISQVFVDVNSNIQFITLWQDQ